MEKQYQLNYKPFIYSVNKFENKLLIFIQDTTEKYCDVIIKYSLNLENFELLENEKVVVAEDLFNPVRFYSLFGKHFNKRLSNIYKLDSFIGIEKEDLPITNILKIVKFTDLNSTFFCSPNDIIPTGYRDGNGTDRNFNYTGELPYYEISPKSNFILSLAPTVMFSQIIDVKSFYLHRENKKQITINKNKKEWSEKNKELIIDFIKDYKTYDAFGNESDYFDYKTIFDSLDKLSELIDQIPQDEIFCRDIFIENPHLYNKWDEDKIERVKTLIEFYRKEILIVKEAEQKLFSSVGDFSVINKDAQCYYPNKLTLYIDFLKTFCEINFELPINDAHFSPNEKFLILRDVNDNLSVYNLQDIQLKDYKFGLISDFNVLNESKLVKNIWFSNDDRLVITYDENSDLILYEVNRTLIKLSSFKLDGINWLSISEDKSFAIGGLDNSIFILDLVECKIIKSIVIMSNFGILSLDSKHIILFFNNNISTTIKIFKIFELFDIVSNNKRELVINNIRTDFVFRRYKEFVSFSIAKGVFIDCNSLKLNSVKGLGLKHTKNFRFRGTSNRNKYTLYSTVIAAIHIDGGFDSALSGEADWRDGSVDIDDHFFDTEEKYYLIYIYNNEAKKYLRPIKLRDYPLISTNFSVDEQFLFITFYNGAVYKINLFDWEKLPFRFSFEFTSSKTNSELDELNAIVYHSLAKIKNNGICNIGLSNTAKFLVTERGILSIDKIAEIKSEVLEENIYEKYFNILEDSKISYWFYEQDYGEQGSVENKRILYFSIPHKSEEDKRIVVQSKGQISYDFIKECYVINEHLFIERKDNLIIKISNILERTKALSLVEPEYTSGIPDLMNEFAITSFVVFSSLDEYVAINDLSNKSIRIFSLRDNELIGKIDYRTSEINVFIFSKDSEKIFASDDEGNFIVFSMKDFNEIKRIKLSLFPILFIIENDDNSVTVFTQYNAIKVFQDDMH